jgi:predicted short-subunit dehydrogenase-like oxidoreductase (DUF2520 family)
MDAGVSSIAGLRLAVAGPGRVGVSLALWAQAAAARLIRVGSRRPLAELDPALQAALARDGGECVPFAELHSADCDLLLIAVADDALAPCAAELARRPQAPVVLHVSGTRDAGVLADLSAASAVGACHPLRAFAHMLPAPEGGTFYALDGGPQAVGLARRLVAAWGGEGHVIAGEARWLYHLAATLAAGGVTTVLAAVRELMAAAGLPPALFPAYVRLLRGAVAAVPSVPADVAAVEAAITGPAIRGDGATLERQRQALAVLAPQLMPVVVALQDEAWRRRRGIGRADSATYRQKDVESPRLEPIDDD